MDARQVIHTILSPRVIAAALALAVVLSCITLFVLWITRSAPGVPVPVTAVFNVIPAPTETRVPPTPTPQASEQVTPTIPPLAGSILFAKGDLVQISGTGGDGVRLRSTPGLNGDVKFLGLESEVFQVEDGPQVKDGYTWWYLVAPYDANIHGWAVANYLVPAQQP
jgi:hypothetical protein